MNIGRSRLVAAALMGMLAVAENSNPGRKVLVVDDDPPRPPPPKDPPPEPPVDAQARYDAACISGGIYAKRQGERIARQKVDYSASDKCIARIKARNAR